MILYLDVVSSIPEFSIIEDNKIIFSTKIIHSVDEKLSNNIIPKYLEMDKSFKFQNNLKGLIITTGPGSYTSLRVGAAFIAGLKYSKDIKTASVSSEIISKLLISDSNKINELVYINSANSQNFISLQNNKNIFTHYKIDNEYANLPKEVKKIYFNEKPLKNQLNNIKYEKFNLNSLVVKNLNKINFSNKNLIKPIYVSNNKLLN
tara:strand:+ start:138 stop:752 length:615 start_codon:yes stop_codon:yes gene_type:complete